MNRYQDQVVVITGASRGIGRETALRVGAEGATVVVNYKRNEDAAQEVVAQVTAAGGRGLAVQADVAEPDEVSRLFDTVRAEYGRVDALVANAAASAFKPLVDIKPHHLEKTFAITVGGFLGLVQGAVDLMGSGGRVVAVSGWDSFRVMRGHGTLGAAKAAMESMVRYLAVELAERDVIVSGVCPGPIVTDSFRIYAGDAWSHYEETWLPYSPLRRFGSPEEIARIVAFLASAENTWITGQTIIADGGLSLTATPL
jgi:enoyl-[acyl-carrier protein] reductase III